MSGLTGLFLGAGASFEAGMPLVWQLTKQMKDWLTPSKFRELNAAWASKGGGYPADVIDDFVSVLMRDDLHYEAILGYVEVQQRRQIKNQQHYNGLYVWLVNLVYQLLYFIQVNNDQFFKQHLHHYDGIKGLVEANNPLWVFSLNHDLLIECIAARHSIDVSCGFGDEVITLPRRDVEGKRIGEIRAEVLTGEQIEKSAMPFFMHGRRGVNLLKVHGSLDTFTFRDGKDYLRLIPDEVSAEGVCLTLRMANEQLHYTDALLGGKLNAINEIAYADDNGEMQFLRRSLLTGAFKFDAHRSQVLPKKILDHFSANINQVTNLVCVGYGFGDIHINGIIRRWLEISSDRRLEVVDPYINGVPSFVLHLAPQVTLTKANATDRLDELGGVQRTSKEKSEREFLRYSLKKGKEVMAQEMREFTEWEITERKERLFNNLTSLPKKDGKPDFEATGMTPEQLAKKWASVPSMEYADVCERFFAYIKSLEGKKAT